MDERDMNEENIFSDTALSVRELRDIICDMIEILSKTKKVVLEAERELKWLSKGVDVQGKRKYLTKEEKEVTPCTFCGATPIYSRGLCRNCYQRALKKGTPKYSDRTNKMLEQREAKEKEKEERLKNWQFEIAKAVLPDIESYEDLNDTVEVLLEELTEAQKKILVSRFKDGDTLKEAGKILGVTPERARQIQWKALRRLRYGTREEKLRKGLRQWTSDQQEKAERINKLFEDTMNENFERLKEPFKRPLEQVEDMPILGLDLPVRSINCLYRAGFNSVKDVLRYLYAGNELTKVPNLGAKSEAEIYKKLEEMGLYAR